MNEETNDQRNVADFVLGAAVGAAANAGWPSDAATLIGIRAQDGVSGRVAIGRDLEEAFADSVADAELVVLMNFFCRSFQATDDPIQSFEETMEIKRIALAEERCAETVLIEAKELFTHSVNGGLQPHAALLNAYISCVSRVRRDFAATE